MKVKSFSDLRKKKATRKKHSRKLLAASMANGQRKLAANITSIEPSVNKVFMAFSDPKRQFTISQVKKIRASLLRFDNYLGTSQKTLTKVYREALSADFPVDRIAEHTEAVGLLRSKISMLKAQADESLLEIDENGFVMDEEETVPEELEMAVEGEDAEAVTNVVPVTNEDAEFNEGDGEDDFNEGAEGAEVIAEAGDEQERFDDDDTDRSFEPSDNYQDVDDNSAEKNKEHQTTTPDGGVQTRVKSKRRKAQDEDEMEYEDDEMMDDASMAIELSDSGIDQALAEDILGDGITMDDDEMMDDDYEEEMAVSTASRRSNKKLKTARRTGGSVVANDASLLDQIVAQEILN